MMRESQLPMKLFVALGLFAPAFAWQSQQQPGQTAPEPTESIRTTVNVVLAPTTVTDKEGNFIAGLQPSEFSLFDNGKKQRLSQDISVHPLSMVVLVQANNEVTEALPRIQKIGNLIGEMVVGDNGEAALVEFDHRLQTLLNFTSDPGQIGDAFKKIKPGSSSSRMIDAVSDAIKKLRTRPDDRRRVILLISETRDNSSENHVREVLTEAQFANVAIYSINISHLVAELTKRDIPPAPSPIPTTAEIGRPGVATTPTTVSQNRDLGSVVPAFEEIFKGVKGIFVSDPMDAFTKLTGGRQYSFVKEKTLEHDLIQLGQELHNQYLLSYHPDNLSDAGYHNIQVVVDRPGLQVRTRPGYWSAGGQ